MKELSGLLSAAGVALLFQASALPAWAEQQQFLLPKTGASEAVSGQIDWPSGKLEHWNGPVAIIVPGLMGTDRDGWSLLELATPHAVWAPFSELADALVRQGFAVARFEAPAVMPPTMKCRGTIRRQGLDESVVTSRCLKMDVLLRSTIDTHFDGIERVVAHLQKAVPGARQTTLLAAIGQDMQLAAQVADRGNVKVHGLATIGGTASSFKENARWQAVGRAIETLPAFDANADGNVSDDEIVQGYAQGIGKFRPLPDWRHQDGASWTTSNIEALRGTLQKNFDSTFGNTCADMESGCLYTQKIQGVSIPLMSGATLHYLLQSQAPIDIMAARRIPGLFLWGEKSGTLAVPAQATLATGAWRNGVTACVVRYASLHMMLSPHSDDEWMSRETLDDVAGKMRAFVTERLRRAPVTSLK